MAEKFSRPFYSIIVPAFNRAGELRELLHSLNDVIFPRERFEVIISDDGSTDETKALVESFQPKSTFELRYLQQINRGPGAARNHGMEQARGDFFIFVDSDVTFPPDWLANISRAVEQEKADAFGGPDTYRESFPPLLKAINYSMTSFLTTGGLRGGKGKRLARFYPRSFNMGLSRALWQRIGGFGDLRHGQDIEFSHRIIDSGAHVIYVDDAPVYHKRRTNLRRFFRQVFNWGVARINLYKINNTMLEPLHTLPAVFTLIVIVLLLAAPFSVVLRQIIKTGILLAVFVLLFAMWDAVRIYHQWRPALWLPLVMPAQVIGYGLGFIYNFIRRVILGKAEKTGFTRHYYR